MLEAKLQHASILRRLFESIKDMVTDVNLECDETGLRLQAMDQSHVALVALKLDDVGFVHFRCDRERSLGLNLPSVCKVFKLCNPNDSCNIQNEEDSESVMFVFENEADERLSSFSLRLMAIDQDALQVPDDPGQSDVVVKMSAKDFANTIRTMGEFSDSVRIEVDKLGIKFVTQGDLGLGEVLMKPKPFSSDEGGVEIQVNSPVSQTYAVKYLSHFAKAASLSNLVTLCLSSQNPIEVRFDILEPTAGGTGSAAGSGGGDAGAAGEDEQQGGDRAAGSGSSSSRQRSNRADMQAAARAKIGHVKFFLAPKMDEDELQDAAAAAQGDDMNHGDSMMDD